MNRSKIVGFTIATVLVVAVIALIMAAYKSRSVAVVTTPTPTPAASAAASTGSPEASPTATTSTTIIYNGSTFLPAQVSVKAGQTITFKNDSSVSVDVDSDPHPIHTDDPDLNAGDIDPGHSKTITVHKTGSFGIHNHLNPSQKGHVTVQ